MLSESEISLIIFGYKLDKDALSIIAFGLFIIILIICYKLFMKPKFSDGKPCCNCGHKYCFKENGLEFCNQCETIKSFIDK